MLLCGAKRTKVTPKPGLEIPGYIEGRIATGVLDDLFTHAIVIDNTVETVFLISVDIEFVGLEFLTYVRDRLRDEVGVFPQNVIICATHIHTGSPVYFDEFLAHKNIEEYNRIRDITLENALAAYACRQPARIGFGEGHEDKISFNRNYYMADGSIKTNQRRSSPEIVRPVRPIDYAVGVLNLSRSAEIRLHLP